MKKTFRTSFLKEAEDLGFVAVGFSRAQSPVFFDDFCSWVRAGKHGEMDWLARNLDLRRDPEKLLDHCKTVISLAYPYPREKPCTPDGFTAARYSTPLQKDYHDRLRRLTQRLARHVVKWFSGERTRVCVDSAPILERAFAYTSGLGFIGKNNMLIIPGTGSYVFLSEILTTAPLTPTEAEPLETRCDECDRCVVACPTGALESPHNLDASRCLSYLTIEDPRPVTEDTGEKMGDCFFGCDICQEVCPFNEGEFARDPCLPTTDEILAMDEEEFGGRFGKTALARRGPKKVKSNILAVRSRIHAPEKGREPRKGGF